MILLLSAGLSAQEPDVVERLFTGNGFAPEPSRCSLLKHPLTAN